ncbi:hypothetical protein yc1106_06843 [Curvularia clavata]|uniref:Uncharacterized protein n=1 Tax=Curvularia clavata TaxID=95742 RepID=A0A9Q9DV77_CURCL|nr:hypothetical protein yc1106_06843 [Curvularia clavata]
MDHHSTPGVSYAPCVELQRMRHVAYIRQPGEDWAGITNPKERKRLQNRLNKRVSRQRKKWKLRSEDDDSSDSVSRTATSPAAVSLGAATASSRVIIPSTFSHCSEEDAVRGRAMLQRFADQALERYMRGHPCADHYLKLIQFNIINGFTKNAAVLGYQFDWLICAAVSPFGCDPATYKAYVESVAPSIPSNLMPTKLQLTMRHHPWLDLFPLPRMRDNLLTAVKLLSPEEEQQLFEDIMESGGGKSEWTGLVVWGEPWDPKNWEVSKPFLDRWAWLLKGCPEIIESTNHWRGLRGEMLIPTPGFILEEGEYDAGSW